MSEIRTVLIVDLPNLFWSIALGGGLKNTNAAREITLREIRTHAPGYDRVAVANDVRGRSFRAALWDPVADSENPPLSHYKAGRSERPDQLWSLLDDVVRGCKAAGWHVFDAPPCAEHEGTFFEGDDVAATLTRYASEELGAAVDILSGDSDLAQLPDDELRIRLLRRYKGTKALDENGVYAWLHVMPIAVVEFKALGGDASDKYKPFPGVAGDTAIKMLAASNWDARIALANVEMSEKKSVIRDKILERGAKRLELGYQLARLRRDVPIDCERLLEQRDAIPIAELGADLVPTDEGDDAPPEAFAEPVEPRAAHVDTLRHSSALATVDPTARMLISPAEVRQRLTEFQALIKTVMVPQIDYGTIPKCGDKPVLFKSGAEKMAEVYAYAPSFEVQSAVERFDEPPLFFYRVKCVLLRKSDRSHVAECIGSANSMETKWGARWVWPRDVPAHLDVARLKKLEFTVKDGHRAGEKAVKYQVPNEQIFDQCNTILKMAEKRAFVGAVLIACRASGVFASDMEDLKPDADAYGGVSDRPQWEQS